MSRELSSGWSLRAASERGVPQPVREAGWIPAAVPGVVHTDLLAAGLIADPYLDDNERLQAWIGSADWEYALDLDWTDDGAERVDLVFEGLDTVATVSLNGHVVLESRNQHRSYRVPVRSWLRPGRNELHVAFRAPVPAANQAELDLGARPHVNHHPYNTLRKMACSFGWDWGIDTATSGIWRAVRLESWSGSRLADVRVVPRLDGDDGIVEVTASIEHAVPTQPHPTRLTVAIAGQEVGVDVPAGAAGVTASVTVPSAERWWPRGFGEPHRYDLGVALASSRGERLDGRDSRIGFRDVRLDMTPDADGTPFRFVINGEPVYIRGVNWIPDDAFPHRVDTARYAARMRQAESAGINLFRIWGGGLYESEDFYEQCDARGMLVWQDLLFACAAYAEEEPMRSEVEAEVREAVTRLGRHPSLVLLNGNNESLEGFEEWGWKQTLDGATWGALYYHELFPAIVAELAPHVPYIPGSPFSPGGVSRPNDPAHGSVHIWDLWNERDWADYRTYRPRFVAEFGWQGPPTWSTLTRSVHDDPLTPTSPGMQVHQKAAEGSRKLTAGLIAHAPLPSRIEDWHWAMQLNQARAVGTALEHFRSLAPLCGGSVVWQFNDSWPVTSWSAVDGDGRPKPLLAAIRHAYADRLVTIQPRGEDLAVVLSNETSGTWSGDLRIERLDPAGGLLASDEVPIEVTPRGVATLAVPAGLRVGDAAADEVLRVRIGSSTAWWFFADYREAGLVRSEVELRTAVTPDGLDVEVSARTLVRDLALLVDTLSPDAAVDDQLVSLLPGETATFHVTSSTPLSPAALIAPGIVRTGNDLVAGMGRVTLLPGRDRAASEPEAQVSA